MADYQKDPADNLDYGFNWSAWMNSGDIINTSSYFAIPSSEVSITSLSTVSSSNFPTSHSTVCFISSGTPGTVYTISNLITTTGGRTVERSFSMQVINL